MNLYDRAGNEIGFGRFSLLLSHSAYRFVRQERVGPYFVSTVWLGIDYGFGLTENPIIFETMVFKDGEIVAVYRYSTEEEAIKGHEKVVNEVSLLFNAQFDEQTGKET